jgi:hypothetical protein
VHHAFERGGGGRIDLVHARVLLKKNPGWGWMD